MWANDNQMHWWIKDISSRQWFPMVLVCGMIVACEDYRSGWVGGGQFIKKDTTALVSYNEFALGLHGRVDQFTKAMAQEGHNVDVQCLSVSEASDDPIESAHATIRLTIESADGRVILGFQGTVSNDGKKPSISGMLEVNYRSNVPKHFIKDLKTVLLRDVFAYYGLDRVGKSPPDVAVFGYSVQAE